MSNNESSRLDRLEALAENILAGLQETRAIANTKSIGISVVAPAESSDNAMIVKDR